MWWITDVVPISTHERASRLELMSIAMELTLLVLAAGMGTRYGGLKQVAPVGPRGEALLDYSVYDALRTGFRRVVFVIRRDMEAAFRATIGVRFERRVRTEYVFQELEAVPAGLPVAPGPRSPGGPGTRSWPRRQRSMARSSR